MKYTLTAILMLSILPAFAQNPPSTPPAPAPPTATEVTPQKPVDTIVPEMAMVKEENLQLKAQAINAQAQQATAPLQQEYVTLEKVIADWIESVKKDNGWGADVSYNRTTKKFERTATPAKK